MKLWKCSVCGYVHWGDEAPEKCPKCRAPKEKFELLDDEAAGLIEKSRVTNDLHMALYNILLDVQGICAEGAEINLDPGCYKIFTELLAISEEKQQEILAEIAGHVKKNKWN